MTKKKLMNEQIMQKLEIEEFDNNDIVYHLRKFLKAIGNHSKITAKAQMKNMLYDLIPELQEVIVGYEKKKIPVLLLDKKGNPVTTIEQPGNKITKILKHVEYKPIMNASYLTKDINPTTLHERAKEYEIISLHPCVYREV